MNNAIYNFREPKNEPVLSYRPGSIERELLEEELSSQKNKIIDIPLIIGGKEIRTGKTWSNHSSEIWYRRITDQIELINFAIAYFGKIFCTFEYEIARYRKKRESFVHTEPRLRSSTIELCNLKRP